MKAIILTIAVTAIIFPLHAQFDKIILDSITSKASFVEIVQVDISKRNIYTSCRAWFVTTFKSANHVIQMDDEDAGIIMGKGHSSIFIETGIMPVEISLYYTIKIQVKDNRYRFELSDLYFKDIPNKYNSYSSIETAVESIITDDKIFTKKGAIRPIRYSYREQVLATANRLLNSLKADVLKTETIKDDW